jgi:N-methylhydantoinase B/oxoprolinase/acetone carboxylase alpha subunit
MKLRQEGKIIIFTIEAGDNLVIETPNGGCFDVELLENGIAVDGTVFASAEE